MGYIGRDARTREVGAERYIAAGPFRWFKLNQSSPAGHPLYFGNLLLVSGTLVSLSPPLFISLIVLIFFVLEYLTIARSEEIFLARRFRGAALREARFSWERVQSEWQTVLAVTVVFGLALARTLLR